MPRGYDQTQAVLARSYYTHEPNDSADWSFKVNAAKDGDGVDRSEETALCYVQYSPQYEVLRRHAYCGDAVVDDQVDASDALAVLRASLGLETCSLCRCYADASGDVTATDALRVLRFAVGHPVDMLCSGCSQ